MVTGGVQKLMKNFASTKNTPGSITTSKLGQKAKNLQNLKNQSIGGNTSNSINGTAASAIVSTTNQHGTSSSNHVGAFFGNQGTTSQQSKYS